MKDIKTSRCTLQKPVPRLACNDETELEGWKLYVITESLRQLQKREVV